MQKQAQQSATDTPATAGSQGMQAMPVGVQGMDPNLILTLARDNRATELAALIQQGAVNVNGGNKVGSYQMHVAHLHGM